MKVIRIVLFTALALLTATPGIAQKKKNKKNKKHKITALALYDGPELPDDQQVRLKSETVGKKYAYFIAVDDKGIPNKSLTKGAQEILLLPGEHKIQMRFVSKGQIAIPIEPFETFSFEAGKAYVVKFEHTHGKGSYLDSAGNTRIRIWIEEIGQEGVLIEKTVNGFGKSLK